MSMNNDDNRFEENVPSTNLVENETVNTETKQLTRSDINSMSNLVKLSDADEKLGLELFCYIKCNESDSELLKNCRGVVFNNDTLVMQAFPYNLECNHTEKEKINEILNENFENYSFYDAHEGSLIRVFYFGDKWFMSTHRKLDAYRSKWSSSNSFGELFEEALKSEINKNETFKNLLPEEGTTLERFYSILDKTKKYMFLVRNNNQNRIVCDEPETPTLYHVGTFVGNNISMSEDIGISYPNKLDLKNIDEIVEYIQQSNYKETQGIIVFNNTNVKLKIFNKDYEDFFKVRGNEPSIKFRYLQIRMNKKLLKMLYYLYPSYIPVFEEYENNLYDISKNIYNSYVQRFIKKRYVTVPGEEFQVIKECHSWHLSNKTENRITLEKVISVLNKQTPSSLNHMIRRLKSEQLHKKENMRIRARSLSSEKFSENK